MGSESAEYAEQIFRTLDSNGVSSTNRTQSIKANKEPTVVNMAAFPQDGVVDFREYVMAISMLIEGSAVEKLRWSFKLYDKDRDGAITREEMLEIMQVCVCVQSQTCWDLPHVRLQLPHEMMHLLFVPFCSQAVYKMNVAAALIKPNPLTAEECTNRIFVRLDKDNNGEEMIFVSLSALR